MTYTTFAHEEVWATAAFAFSRYHDTAFKEREATKYYRTRGRFPRAIPGGKRRTFAVYNGKRHQDGRVYRYFGTHSWPFSGGDSLMPRRTHIIILTMGACT